MHWWVWNIILLSQAAAWEEEFGIMIIFQIPKLMQKSSIVCLQADWEIWTILNVNVQFKNLKCSEVLLWNAQRLGDFRRVGLHSRRPLHPRREGGAVVGVGAAVGRRVALRDLGGGGGEEGGRAGVSLRFQHRICYIIKDHFTFYNLIGHKFWALQGFIESCYNYYRIVVPSLRT